MFTFAVHLLCLILGIFTLVIAAGSRHLLEDNVLEDAQEGLNNFIDSFWGGKCVQDSGCASFIAYCDKNAGITRKYSCYQQFPLSFSGYFTLLIAQIRQNIKTFKSINSGVKYSSAFAFLASILKVW